MKIKARVGRRMYEAKGLMRKTSREEEVSSSSNSRRVMVRGGNGNGGSSCNGFGYGGGGEGEAALNRRERIMTRRMVRELRLMAKGKQDEKEEGKVNEVMEGKKDEKGEGKVMIGLKVPKEKVGVKVVGKAEAEVAVKVEEEKGKESLYDHQTQVSAKQVVVADKCHDKVNNNDNNNNNNNNVEAGGWEKYGVGWTPWSCEEEQALWMGGDCFNWLTSATAAVHPPNHYIAPDHGEDAAWEVFLWNL